MLLGRKYKITWKGEGYTEEGIYVGTDRGFLLFEIRGRVVSIRENHIEVVEV